MEATHTFHVMLSIYYLAVNFVYLNLSLFILNVCICSRARCQSTAVRYGCPSGVRGRAPSVTRGHRVATRGDPGYSYYYCNICKS